MSDFDQYSLLELTSSNNDQIVDHFLSLSKDDLYLRFGYSVNDENIQQYVANSISSNSYQTNFWWGLFDQNKLIATIHVALMSGLAEFAFTTDSEYRGKKLGQLLFARGYRLVTERKIDKIVMACLSKNKPMIHIAKKFGMAVLTHGADSEASITIQYPVPLSRLHEVEISIMDKGIGR